MASLGTSFDPNSVAPSTGGGGKLHPEGDFELEPIESSVDVNSGGTGKVAKWVFQNTGRDDPALKGIKIFANMNIEHTSAQAQAIGQGELSALCAATGFTGQLDDTEQLHFMPFYARIVHEPAMDKKTGYKTPLLKADGSPLMNAVVKRYLFGDGEAPPAGAQPPAGKPAAQAAAPTPAPAHPRADVGPRTWQRKSA